MIDQVAKKSREHFISGFYCAESVLLAIADTKGIESEVIPKIATGFCSGMARTGGQCGALSGAILSMGLVHGRSAPGASIEAAYAKVKSIRSMFHERFGGTDCSELLGIDLGTEEGQARFSDENLLGKCLDFTEAATRMALILLEEEV